MNASCLDFLSARQNANGWSFLVVSSYEVSVPLFFFVGWGVLYYLRLTCSFQNADVGYPRKKDQKNIFNNSQATCIETGLREIPVNPMLEK